MAVLALAACADDTSSATPGATTSVPAPSTPATVAPTTAVPAPTTAGPATIPPPEHTSETGLEALLLGTEDLPAEFAATAIGEQSASVEMCGFHLPDDLEPIDFTSVTYSSGKSSTYLSEYLALVDPTETAQSLTDLESAIAGCSEWVQSGSSGEEVVYAIEPIGVPLPPGTIGFTATASVEELGQVQSHSGIVEQGGHLLWISYSGVGDDGVPAEELARYVQLAIDQLGG